jgi:flagellar protein FliO/FliZ
VSEPAFALGELVKLVFALGITIGLFYALALFMKRMQVGTGKSGTLITVLAAMPLGGKEKIWVLDIAGEKLVVGTSPGNVNCLHVLKDPAAADVLVEQAQAAANATPLAAGFAELLQNFRGGPKS